MKFDFNKREFKVLTIFCLSVILIGLSISYFLIDNYKMNIEDLLNNDLNKLEGEIESSMKSYESFSNYIYDNIKDDDIIIDIISEASFADDVQKEVLRNELYDYLNDTYEIMVKHEFRQFHFHLPNTESFLRFHKPENYGDLLYDVRESINLVNENQVKVSGFEEGRIFNGYRFVYPLFKDDELSGTVEISISIGSVIKVLSKLNPESDFYFIIRKDVVDKKVFESQIVNYSESLMFNDYYVDKAVESISEQYSDVPYSSEKEFLELVNEKFNHVITGEKKFDVIDYRNDEYVIMLVPIVNFENDAVSYIVSIQNNFKYNNISSYLIIELFLITGLSLLLIISGYFITISYIKTKLRSERDYLTGIYKRSKFTEIFNYEIKKSKRYNYSMCLFMIDIDYFKIINDTYGHEAGDKVLKQMSVLVNSIIRNTDCFARWGGEEFVILSTHIDKIGANVMAEKIRKTIEECKEGYMDGLTVSIGVFCIEAGEFIDLDSVIKKADDSLYEAKKKGRNKVCIYD